MSYNQHFNKDPTQAVELLLGIERRLFVEHRERLSRIFYSIHIKKGGNQR